MRAGPGTQYGVVATIPGGATVDVGELHGSWCQVNFDGASGFASASYLAIGGEAGCARSRPGYVVYDAVYAYDYD